MALNSPGLNALADGIGTKATLELVAGIGVTEIANAVVSYGSASSGNIAISGDVSLTIPGNLASPYNITHVYLRTIGEPLANAYATEILSANNTFPNGGDLIVKSYTISVDYSV